jgi:hypothetical protein
MRRWELTVYGRQEPLEDSPPGWPQWRQQDGTEYARDARREATETRGMSPVYGLRTVRGELAGDTIAEARSVSTLPSSESNQLLRR